MKQEYSKGGYIKGTSQLMVKVRRLEGNAYDEYQHEESGRWIPIIPAHMIGTDNATGIRTMLAKLERDTR